MKPILITKDSKKFEGAEPEEVVSFIKANYCYLRAFANNRIGASKFFAKIEVYKGIMKSVERELRNQLPSMVFQDELFSEVRRAGMGDYIVFADSMVLNNQIFLAPAMTPQTYNLFFEGISNAEVILPELNRMQPVLERMTRNIVDDIRKEMLANEIKDIANKHNRECLEDVLL